MENDEAPTNSIYARVLRRAAETVGGIEPLAEELNVSVAALQWWLDARDVPSHEIFAAALSIDALGPYYIPRKQREPLKVVKTPAGR